MNCYFCKDKQYVLKNTYAGEIQQYDENQIYFEEQLINNETVTIRFEKRVKCHLCNNGGPSNSPEEFIINVNQELQGE